MIRMMQQAQEAELLLKQLANAHRLMIACQLIDGEKNVSELSDIIGLSQSAISQHLAKMRDGGLVTHERRGQMVYYSLSSMEARALLSVLYFMFCKDS